MIGRRSNSYLTCDLFIQAPFTGTKTRCGKRAVVMLYGTFWCADCFKMVDNKAGATYIKYEGNECPDKIKPKVEATEPKVVYPEKWHSVDNTPVCIARAKKVNK